MAVAVRTVLRSFRNCNNLLYKRISVIPYRIVRSISSDMTSAQNIDYTSKEELKKRLTPLQYHVTQEKGTERPFTGIYNKTSEKGLYSCIVCELPLFSSDTKFDSHCGWPAFNEVLDQGKVKLTKDTSNGLIRTEVTCSKCNAHLGHVFMDGPPPTRKRFCINSASLQFHPGVEAGSS